MEPHFYLDAPWYHYSAAFPSAGAAWGAWQAVEEGLAGAQLDLGVYRHGPSTDPARFVTVISLRGPQGVLRARRIIRKTGGTDHRIEQGELEALIARRIRFVATEAPKGETGHAEIHHLGHGSKLNPDGTFAS
jgi:hypothetical protein